MHHDTGGIRVRSRPGTAAGGAEELLARHPCLLSFSRKCRVCPGLRREADLSASGASIEAQKDDHSDEAVSLARILGPAELRITCLGISIHDSRHCYRQRLGRHSLG